MNAKVGSSDVEEQSDGEPSITSSSEPLNISKDRLVALRLLSAISTANYNKPNENSEETVLTVLMEVAFQLVSPLGLLGNLASIISIGDRWRVVGAASNGYGETLSDVWWVYLLNSLALTLGCVGNVVLYLHLELWLARHVCILITSICYISAVFIYMAMLGATEHTYFHRGNGDVHRTLGYWQAVCASVLYFVSALITVTYALHFRNRKWNDTSSRQQRTVMTLSLFYIAWIAIGGAAFQAKTMLNQSYANAVYFAIVSALTLGYGDITPQTNLSKALDIPFIYIGIIIGGWFTYAVFQADLSRAHGLAIDVAVELRRRELIKKKQLSEKESFEAIRQIVRSCQLRDQFGHVMLTLLWLVNFWLCGALIFSYTEQWEYFDAFYMCAISLASVGYGDFVPSSPGGRSVFTHWALMAVPTMATAVSDLGPFIIMLVEQYGDKTLFNRISVHRAKRRVERAAKWKSAATAKEADTDSKPLNAFQRLFEPKERSTMPPTYIEVVSNELPPDPSWRNIVTLTTLDSKCHFDYYVWHQMVCALLNTADLLPGFWLSEDSPLRHPSINERKFMLSASLHLLQFSQQAQLPPKIDVNETV